MNINTLLTVASVYRGTGLFLSLLTQNSDATKHMMIF